MTNGLLAIPHQSLSKINLRPPAILANEIFCPRPAELEQSSQKDHRSDFIARLRTIRRQSESSYHENLLAYCPSHWNSKALPQLPAQATRGIWYTDSHLLCRRSDAAPLIYSLHRALSRCSYAVSLGDEFDFAWSELKDPIKRAVDFKIRLAKKYPHCSFYTIAGNHDGCDNYISALQEASKSQPNIVVQRYALRLGSHVFTHGDCVHWNNPTTNRIDRYRASYNNGWKPNLAERLLERATHRLGLHSKIPQHLLELLIPRKVQAERLLAFINQINPTLLDGARTICFGHTHKAFRGFEYQGYRFVNGGAHEEGFRPSLHKFVVRPD